MAKFAAHMGDPHGDPQTSPQHADPRGFLVWFSLKRPQIHVDRRVAGWLRAAMWITHVGSRFRHGLLEKSLIKLTFFHTDFGKEFPSRTLWKKVHPETAPLQAVRCALRSTEQSPFRGGEGAKMCREKGGKRRGGEEAWAAKGAKRKKGRMKTGQKTTIF